MGMAIPVNRLRPLPARLWALVIGVSVRAKILGMVLALVLLLGLVITMQVRLMLTNALYRELEHQGVALGRDLAARSTDPILIHDLFALHQLLDDTLTNNPDVRYAFILDPEGRVLVHTFEGGFPKGLADANSVPAGAHHQLRILSTEEGSIWDTAAPIFVGHAGTARVGLSDRLVQQTVRDVTARLMLTTAAVSLIGLTVGGALTWVLTYPIERLVRATEAVGRGDLHYQASVWADDEIGALSRAFNTMTNKLAQAEKDRGERERLRAQLLDSVITAQEEERKRISRELHDGASQSLTSLKVGLRVLADACTQAKLQDYVADLQLITQATLDELHSLALELRPRLLDDLGLVAALQRHIRKYEERFGLKVDFGVVGLDDRRLSPALETTLYRIIQETLTNVVRHAEATTVSILLEQHDGRVRAIIEDDGRGFDPTEAMADGRLGLYGIEERATLLGGRLIIESRHGHGSSIFVEMPLTLAEEQTWDEDTSPSS